jgi:hypothetical protein
MKKTVTFINMSKGYREVPGIEEIHKNKKYGSDIVFAKNIFDNDKSKLPFTKSNYFDILNELSKDESIAEVNYIFLMSEVWMKRFCLGKKIARKDLSNKFNMICSSNINDIVDYVENSNLVIIRGNYEQWNNLLGFIRCNYIFLPCHAEISPDRLRVNLNLNKSHIFVDDHNIMDNFSSSKYNVSIFKKPAALIFYKKNDNIKKDIDIVFVCSKTDREHKRLDLFLESLVHLNKITKTKINAVVVGNSSHHKDFIDSINLSMVSLTTAYDGRLASKVELADVLDRSKIKVCTSSIDANPRVIVECLAKNIPVLCAKDLMGGKFQINEKTGMFFDPNPKSLAEKIIEALSKLDTFSPRENCIKIQDTIIQIKSFID